MLNRIKKLGTNFGICSFYLTFIDIFLVNFPKCQRTASEQSRFMSTSTSDDIWKLGRLNHVAVATPDLSATAKFYKDVLRAKVNMKLY